MQKTQNIPKVASKAIAIVVALILAFAFVFEIGYYFGKRSVESHEDNAPGVAEASPTEPEPKETMPELEPNIPERKTDENIQKPENLGNTEPPVSETVTPKKQYTVQVGAFQYVYNANRVMALIKSRDYTVWINPPKGHSSLHKVRVGKFDSRNQARNFGERIIDFIVSELDKMGYPVKREYRVIQIQ